jgi:hypothetical protein
MREQSKTVPAKHHMFASVSAALLIVSLLAGCSLFNKALGSGSNSIEPGIVRVCNTNGDFTTQEVIAGESRVSSLRLGGVGDQIRILNNKSVNIDVTDFDSKHNVIVTEVSSSNDEIIMRVERKSTRVKFTTKCQVYTIGNTDVLPPIEVEQGLDIQQIIITPLCDGVNSIIGYEIRYGSTEAGCRGQARQGQEKYRRCREKKRGGPSNPCRYFGVGCS